MRFVGVLLLVGMLAGVARADIYEWRDSDGVLHYTNLKEWVPASTAEPARVFVIEPVPRADAPATVAAPAEPVAPRQAQVVYDPSFLEAAYEQGWREGLERAQGAGGPSVPVSVQINGPLVAAAGGSGGNPYPYPYYAPWPLVTTSFDRGRSRHLTLRMLLQDQFAIDREGPFIFEGAFPRHVPGELNLNTFLPRGLPHALTPPGRVITH